MEDKEEYINEAAGGRKIDLEHLDGKIEEYTITGFCFDNEGKRGMINMENTKESNMVFISTDSIHPHPDNPRKDLGDLTELTDSIKKNGIMQNLTVIPGHWEESGHWEEDGYTLIIGHRRFAARTVQRQLYSLTNMASRLTSLYFQR